IDGYDLVAPSVGRQTDPAAAVSLLDYLPDDTVVCIVEPAEVAALAEAFHHRLGKSGGVFDPQELETRISRLAVAELWAFGPTRDDGIVEVKLGIQSIQRLETATDEALAELERLCADNEVWVYCENPAERERFGEILATSHAALAKKVTTVIGHVRHGFYWPGEKLVLAAHHEIFHRHVPPRRLRRVRSGRPIDSFIDLQIGDYVVHVNHGIARFEGLRQLERDERTEEYLTLRFADRALLHVPVTEIQLVQKYIGSRRGHPTLSKLGGKSWALRKQRVAEAVHDLAAELLRIQAIRATAEGVSYAGESEWLGRFEQEFPYTETEDQLSAMKDISADLAEARPMDRLLCGDVGYGKTELAMRAAFKVVEAGPELVFKDGKWKPRVRRPGGGPAVCPVVWHDRGAELEAWRARY
ncbi:hypothetical protein LCGC14_2785170, partial [marine sediment metagenome]